MGGLRSLNILWQLYNVVVKLMEYLADGDKEGFQCFGDVLPLINRVRCVWMN